MAAVTLPLDEFLDEVPALVIGGMPVDHCAVHTGAPTFTPGVRAFPIGVHGNPVGMLTVWRDGGEVCLSAAEKSELCGVAAVIGLAMVARSPRTSSRTSRSKTRS